MMNLKIGLTGGIGSGKSMVAKAFSKLGAPVINADNISHELIRKDQPAYREIIRQFNHTEMLMLKNGEIDRTYLGNLVFNDLTLKMQLEHILHPLIRQEIAAQVKTLSAPYIVLEYPLLVGTPFHADVDRILVVSSNESLRIKRIVDRNGWSEQKIRAVMNAQLPETVLISAADDIIENNAKKQAIEVAVAKLHIKYQTLSTLK